MPTIHHAERELLLKIVYYGPGLGGKTTNLEYIHAHTRKDRRGKLLSLRCENERTLFFDLLPMDLGHFKGYRIRLHLCTVPGQVFHDRTRRLVLRNVDGVVFVADSQREAMDSNLESLDNLFDNLVVNGQSPDLVPVVVQYNKQDLEGVMTPDELRVELCIPQGLPEFRAAAKFGVGVYESLKAAVKECLNLIKDPQNLPSGRVPSILPGHRLSMYADAAAPAAEQSFSATLPKFGVAG